MVKLKIHDMSQDKKTATTEAVKVMHVIAGLHVGGAEMMLYRLLSKSSLQKNSVVVSLSDGGELINKISDLGVKVIVLPRGSILKMAKSLTDLVRQQQPTILQSWLYRADLLAAWAAWRTKLPLIWNVRQTEVAKVDQQTHIWWAQRISAVLSKRVPKKIIYCAQAARESHENIGYAQSKGVVIHNGIDTLKFSLDESLRRTQRQEWNVLNDEMLIGMVGRYDPLKNHARFLRILRDVIRLCPKHKVKAVLVGRHMNAENSDLMVLVQKYQLAEKVVLVDEVEHTVPVYSALDIHLLTSDNEGWPNVLAEAMSVGLPCVATDVGDVGSILDDTSAVVIKSNETQLVEKVVQYVHMPKTERWKLGKLNREKIQRNSSLQSAVERYDDLYLKLSD